MRTFLYCEAGFVEKEQWLPNSWVNVECPTPEDIHYLTNQFNVPESFLSDIADTDERPRDRKSTRLNSSHIEESRMPSSA